MGRTILSENMDLFSTLASYNSHYYNTPMREAKLMHIKFVKGSFALLTRKQREVLELHFLQNMTIKEIADYLSTDQSVISRRKKAALMQLREYMNIFKQAIA